MPGRCTVFLLLMLAASSAAGGARGLCKASETNYFSCQSASKQWIGMCGSATGAV